jgi:excinuclease ABC subunit B
MDKFLVESPFQPAGDQPAAIAAHARGVEDGLRFQTLEGITGSGKTATIAWLVEHVQRPTLILEPNKSLAAQLASELKEMLPQNRVEFFVSYYDYYQPEAYIPRTDTFIEKDSSINEEIDRLRHAATSSLLTHRDTIVVASVSCIYGLGSPLEYRDRMLQLEVGTTIDQRALLRRLVEMQYNRNELVLERGTFRMKGDTLEIQPAYSHEGIRVSFFDNEIEEVSFFNPLTRDSRQGEGVHALRRVALRHEFADSATGLSFNRRRVAGATRNLPTRGKAVRGAATSFADRTRSRNARTDRCLCGDRELLRAPRWT